MLNNLYRKLHILFASSVMLIITLVISFVVANTVHTEKINESTLFQRLTTLLIYQVESASSIWINHSQPTKKVIIFFL